MARPPRRRGGRVIATRSPFCSDITKNFDECLRIDTKGVVSCLAATHQNWVTVVRAKLIDRTSYHLVFFETIRLLYAPAALLIFRTEFAHGSHQRKYNSW